MLSWIAASTARIGIASKVLCVPLRLPSLTAKMAESLQRLSGGRLILGLGAGFSDEEMRSLGVSPPSARDKVDGLDESVRLSLAKRPAKSLRAAEAGRAGGRRVCVCAADGFGITESFWCYRIKIIQDARTLHGPDENSP